MRNGAAVVSILGAQVVVGERKILLHCRPDVVGRVEYLGSVGAIRQAGDSYFFRAAISKEVYIYIPGLIITLCSRQEREMPSWFTGRDVRNLLRF